MPRLTLPAGAEGVERKYHGRFIFVRGAEGPLSIIIDGDRYECIKGSKIGPVDPGFTSITLDNRHGAANEIDLEITRNAYGENLLILDKGTEAAPLVVKQAGERIFNFYSGEISAGGRDGYAFRPSAEYGIRLESFRASCAGNVQVYFRTASLADIDAEGWTEGDFVLHDMTPAGPTMLNGSDVPTLDAATPMDFIHEAGAREILVPELEIAAGSDQTVVVVFENQNVAPERLNVMVKGVRV